MKKVMILFGKSNWRKSAPFSNKDYQYSYEYFYSLCQQNGIQMYRASYEWYDYQRHFFKYAWIYKGNHGRWEKVYNIRPDLIYDKTKGRAEVYYKKELMHKKYKFVNDLYFTKMIDDKFITGLIFANFSKESSVVRNKKELITALSKIKTDISVLKPISDSGGKNIQILSKKLLRKMNITGEYLIQEFIDSSQGVPGIKSGAHDLRLVFVNNEVVYAYIREPKKGGVLANLAQGGSLTIVKKNQIPDSVAPIVDYAKKVFASFNPKIYTIDLMFDAKERPWVIELNSMPGLYFTPQEKPYMVKMYRKILKVFQDQLGSAR